MKSVHVRVPATSANFGPGFDAFGVALELYNEVIVGPSSNGELTIEFSGEGENQLKQLKEPRKNLIIQTFEKGLNYLNVDTCIIDKLSFKFVNRIPLSRGLGSSSAAIVSGLFSAFAFCAHNQSLLPSNTISLSPYNSPFSFLSLSPPSPLSLNPETLESRAVKDIVFSLSAEIEGHPDNVAPAVYGYYQLCIGVEPSQIERERNRQRDFNQVKDHQEETKDVSLKEIFIPSKINVSTPFLFILLVPDTESSTAETRALIPKTIGLSSTVFNLSRTGFLIDALSNGKLEHLRFSTDDEIHQSKREESFDRYLSKLKDFIYHNTHYLECSALFMSGAGPTIACLSPFSQQETLNNTKDFPQEEVKEIKEVRSCSIPENKTETQIKRMINHVIQTQTKISDYRLIITTPENRGAHLVSSN